MCQLQKYVSHNNFDNFELSSSARENRLNSGKIVIVVKYCFCMKINHFLDFTECIDFKDARAIRVESFGIE